jgi:hypothetical protein
MNQHLFKRFHNISNVIANVICKPTCVKGASKKNSLYCLVMLACASITFAPGPALAQDAKARAIMNSTHLLSFVDGVIPEGLPNVMKAIATGQVQRLEPSFPVWIIDSEKGNVLYYQGQPAFTGQSANRLVDDNGVRFGQRAFDSARRSRSTWVSLTLGGQSYSAYCATKAPFVVCSLIQ